MAQQTRSECCTQRLALALLGHLFTVAISPELTSRQGYRAIGYKIRALQATKPIPAKVIK